MKTKNDFNGHVAVLGLKKALSQNNLDDVFKYRIELIIYQRFCYDEEDFKRRSELTRDERIRLGPLLFENNLNRLEKIFAERYPFLF